MTASLLAFALMEYKRRGWAMPAVHVRIYEWMARTEGTRSRVLMVFRGCGKSTILGIKNAHKLHQNPMHQILVQGADDELTDDVSRDTLSIMRSHPLTRGLLMEPAGIRHWWTRKGLEETARTPQMRGRGVMARVTGNRADEIINDDSESNKNVENPDARAKLRKRLSEQSFILKPGGSKLWVGTPHTYDSIYETLIKSGSEALVIPLFASQTRYEAHTEPRSSVTFGGKVGPDGVWVFAGIGAHARLLSEKVDYVVKGNRVIFSEPVSGLIDVCTGNAWPERFDRTEMMARRQECDTIGYWDQQYQLHAKPLHESRLNPELITPYDAEPRFVTANKVLTMWLGATQIVGCSLRWDPSSGKVNSDVSAAVLDLQDAAGRHYWHRVAALTGNVADTDEKGHTITGGQVFQLCDLIKEFRIPRVSVETNGIGGYAPAFLKTALKQRKLRCGVIEVQATANKNKRILEALEPPIASGMLWAHVSVLEGPLWNQMRDWNAAIANQPDDFLDAGAGAITDQPARIGQLVGNLTGDEGEDWRPAAGVFEAVLED